MEESKQSKIPETGPEALEDREVEQAAGGAPVEAVGEPVSVRKQIIPPITEEDLIARPAGIGGKILPEAAWGEIAAPEHSPIPPAGNMFY